jgi:threonine dehydrogenase-like Zn-dependent dehydrogenase
MTRTGRSVMFTDSTKPLEIHEHEIPDPRPGEFLARITHAGVCGTDGHRLKGDVPTPPGPICFGHEVVGEIEALGEGLTHDRFGVPLAVGDRVYWSPPTPCGECAVCRAGRTTALCPTIDWPAAFGPRTAAGYQDYATVRATAPFYRIPDGATSDSVIALGCGLPTALGGLSRLGDVTGATVVVQGAGPVGLGSCLAVSTAGAAQVIALGDPPHRLAAAERLGADHTIPLTGTTAEQRIATVLKLTDGRGADIVIEAAGHVSAFNEGVAMVAEEGTYLVMGIYSGTATVPFNPVVVNNRDLVIRGSVGNSVADYGRAVELAAKFGVERDLDALVSHRFGLGQTRDAIESAARGEASKAVVQPALDRV